MKQQRQSKLMRMTIFVGVAAGLALGSSVAVAQGGTSGPLAQEEEPFEVETDDPMEGEETEGFDDGEGIEDDSEFAEEDAEDTVDYPSDIEDLEEFITQHQEQRIDNVAEYTEEGAKLMVDAMEEVIPGESGWFRDRPEAYQVFEDDLETWEDRIDELSDHEREDFAQVATDVLSEGADWINALQASAYPALSDESNAVSEAANELDGTQSINEQEEEVQNYFIASLTALQSMYRAHEEDPMTRHDGASIAYAVDGQMIAEGDYGEGMGDDDMGIEDDDMGIEEDEDMGMEDDWTDVEDEGEMAEESEFSPEVQSFSDLVETMDQETLEGAEGERATVDGLRELEGALSLFIEEEVETLEGAQRTAMEDDDELQHEDEMEGEEGTLSEHRDDLNNYIEELEASIGTEEYGENLKTSVDSASELLTAIQEEQFPEFADQANAIREAAENIDDSAVGEQSEELISFFEANREALEAMDQQEDPDEEEPAV